MQTLDKSTGRETFRDDKGAGADLLSRLEERCHEFDFFQAVRRLDALFAVGGYPRIGHAQSRAGDPIHFGQRPFLEFAPRTIDRWADSPPLECRVARPTMLVYFFGLFGPDGVLPLHLTRFAILRQRAGDFTLSNFANVFHHRFLTFYYRAWAATRIAVDLDRPEQQRFAAFIGSFFGEGALTARLRDAPFEFGYCRNNVSNGAAAIGTQSNLSVKPPSPSGLQTRAWPKLFFAGRLAPQVRNAEGLQAIIEYYFGLPARVLAFFGRWFDLPHGAVCDFQGDPNNAALGETAIAGTQFWDCQMSFRLRIGPMRLAEFCRLLPGGESFERLKTWVFDYSGGLLRWDVQLVLDRKEVPDTALDGGSYLGWTSFIKEGERPFDRDADDLVLSPEETS